MARKKKRTAVQFYDAVFWSLVTKLTDFMVPLVNEAFGEDFSNDAKVELLPMKSVVRNTSRRYSRRERDSLARISDGDVVKSYHFECETWPDKKSMAIRIAEYGAAAAFDSVVSTGTGARMTIPNSAVIFLRSSTDMPKEYIIEISYPGGVVSYKSPVINIRDYRLKDLIERRLLILVPFFSFTLDKVLKKLERENDIKPIEDMVVELDKGLAELLNNGDIDEYEKRLVLRYTEDVLKELTGKYKVIAKGVKDIMGGYIIDTDADKILRKGRREGKIEGITLGEQRTIISAHENGHTPEEIAAFIGFDVDVVLAAIRSQERNYKA